MPPGGIGQGLVRPVVGLVPAGPVGPGGGFVSFLLLLFVCFSFTFCYFSFLFYFSYILILV